jgi:hypothetical protein
MHNAIDCTHVEIVNLYYFPEHYYYYKTGLYTIVTQAMVD